MENGSNEGNKRSNSKRPYKISVSDYDNPERGDITYQQL